jgi:hypothetical protein
VRAEELDEALHVRIVARLSGLPRVRVHDKRSSAGSGACSPRF